jgi:RNA polymerase sigma-70 factor, ECF subfamily
LSVTHRTLLLDLSATGKNYRTAAAEAGCAIGTIKSRMSRARRRLAECMA